VRTLVPLFSGASNSIQPALGTAYQPGGVLTPGYYSNLAFQMAGKPQYGPYPATTPPPAPPGGYGIPGGSAGASGAAGGLLGTLAQSPSLAKGAYNTVAGLLGPSLPAVTSPAYDAAITATTSAGIPAATAIAAPTTAEVAAGIGAPASGNLFAGADGAAAAAATDAPSTAADSSSLAGGGVMAGIGLLAALGDIYANSTEKGTAAGQAAQGAVNQDQSSLYSQLLANTNTSDPTLKYYLNASTGGAGQGFPGYSFAQTNPLLQLADLMGRNAAGTAGNDIVQQKLDQTTTGIDPNALYKMLQGFNSAGLLGKGGLGVTAAELKQAGYTDAQIAALGLS